MIDIKPLIWSLWKNHKQEIIDSSFMNCHVKGLHSIMLLKAPEKTIRLYYATSNHELWLNNQFHNEMSLAFHPHHCDLTLHCIMGSFVNWIVEVQSNNLFKTIDKYKYKSPILVGEKGGFELIEKVGINTLEKRLIQIDQHDFIQAESLHSVYVEKGKEAAWLVYEGREDKNYESVAYSMNDLTKFDTSQLYQPASWEQIIDILQRVGLQDFKSL